MKQDKPVIRIDSKGFMRFSSIGKAKALSLTHLSEYIEVNNVNRLNAKLIVIEGFSHYVSKA